MPATHQTSQVEKHSATAALGLSVIRTPTISVLCRNSLHARVKHDPRTKRKSMPVGRFNSEFGYLVGAMRQFYDGEESNNYEP